MNRVFISLVVVFVVVGGLAVFQATQQTTISVLLPSELNTQPKEKLSRIKVGGRVAELLNYQTDPSFELKFKIQDPPNKDPSVAVSPETIAVTYNGLKPDMFAPGRDVIIEGHYAGGILTATKLLTQCPSKYEPPDPENVKEQHASK